MRSYAAAGLLAILLVLSGSEEIAQAAATYTPTFNRDIRPIFSENCYACHGPDKNTRKAKLRLDNPESAYQERDGAYAIVPGKPDESELVAHISSTDPEEIMPPPKSGKKLSAAQITLLKDWIAAGAKYETHWSYLPVRRPDVPAVKNNNWPINPIDNFILARLEKENLEPSDEADGRTLIRRLSFDITGLPPNVDEAKKFKNSSASQSYKSLVRDLLASPHYGERMAMHWLDLVRYADTVGYHGDMTYSVWPYRDYVSKRSTAICDSTNSRANNWRAIFCQVRPVSKKWRPDIIASIASAPRAGFRIRNIWRSTRRIGSEQPLQSGWAARLVVRSATITSSIRS